VISMPSSVSTLTTFECFLFFLLQHGSCDVPAPSADAMHPTTRTSNKGFALRTVARTVTFRRARGEPPCCVIKIA